MNSQVIDGYKFHLDVHKITRELKHFTSFYKFPEKFGKMLIIWLISDSYLNYKLSIKTLKKLTHIVSIGDLLNITDSSKNIFKINIMIYLIQRC